MSAQALEGRTARTEGGSAVVEFLLVAMVLLIPLVYLVLMAAQLQAGTFATTIAAREAARAFVTAPTQASASDRALAAASLTLEDFGFGDQVDDAVDIACSSVPCIQPGATVTVTTTVVVALPLVPAVARDVIPLQVPVTTEHALRVDTYRATPP